jgi:hypothetical protein
MAGMTKELCCGRPCDKKRRAISRRREEGQQEWWVVSDCGGHFLGEEVHL